MDEQVRIQFFKHQVNTRQDEKIIQLLRKEGWAGYGLFWAILEFLGPIKDHKSNCDYQDLAWDLRADAKQIKRIVENYGLFKTQKGFFYSESFSKQLAETNDLIQRRRDAASRAGRESAEARRRKKEHSNDSSTNVVDNSTNVATTVEKSANHIDTLDTIDTIQEKDIRDDISTSTEAEHRLVVSGDDATRHFDNRLGDEKFIKIMRNYMYKGAANPVFEATKLIDVMEPEWQLKDGRSFKGKEEEACFCWQVDRGRKYIDSARLSVKECRGVDRFLELMTAAKVYDPKAYGLFRGCHYDEEKKVFALFVEDAKYVKWFEDNAVKQVVPIFRSLYPGVRFEYQLRKGE